MLFVKYLKCCYFCHYYFYSMTYRENVPKRHCQSDSTFINLHFLVNEKKNTQKNHKARSPLIAMKYKDRYLYYKEIP